MLHAGLAHIPREDKKREGFVSGEGHGGALLSVINGWQGLLFSGLWISCLSLSVVAASH